MNISTVAEMRALDQAAIEQYGIAAELLMENAGHAAYTVLAETVGIRGSTFVVCCGTGNNGGDGLMLARKIHSSGGTVRVFIVGDPEKYTGAARQNLDILRRLPIEVQPLQAIDPLRVRIAAGDVIVDALLGTGITREVAGLYREVIEQINQRPRHRRVLSVDIPSGVNGDTGQVLGEAVQADYTVTFGLPKLGNLLFPGFTRCGRLYVSHISFPPELYNAEHFKVALNDPPALPPRPVTGHKGSFGDVLVIAGAAAYFGAPYFAASAFMKAGGGYARLAAPRAIVPVIAGRASELVFVPQQETPAGSIALSNKAALLELAEQVDIVVLGPGTSLNDETQQLVRELAAALNKPLVLDGDGLTAVCANLDILRTRSTATVLTPHLGEMARLTGLSVPEIGRDSIPIVQRTARDLNAIIVLKGAHSLIGAPDGRVWINLSGNSGMATAGAGDVLAGALAAMVGQGLTLIDAVKKGVFVHGVAGDLAAAELGEDGITAQNLLNALPQAVRSDRQGLPAFLQPRYAGVQVV